MIITVDINGYIKESNLIQPVMSWFEAPMYRVLIEPSYDVLMNLEYQIEALLCQSEKPFNMETKYQKKTECFKGCAVVFESVTKRRLSGGLKNLVHDHEFIGKYINILANARVLPDGNAVISFHQITEVVPLFCLDE